MTLAYFDTNQCWPILMSVAHVKFRSSLFFIIGLTNPSALAPKNFECADCGAVIDKILSLKPGASLRELAAQNIEGAASFF
jgi:hypothetical protein